MAYRKDRVDLCPFLCPLAKEGSRDAAGNEGVIRCHSLFFWRKENHMGYFYEKAAFPVSQQATEGMGAMSEEAWLKARWGDFSQIELTASAKKYLQKHPVDYTVTGSEAGIVMGESPWSAPQSLYAEKLGLLEKEPISKEKKQIFRRGHVFEGPILSLVAEEVAPVFGAKNVDVWTDKRLFLSKKNPCLVCDPDGFMSVRMEDKTLYGYVEVKTISPNNRKVLDAWKAGEIPPVYEWQCHHAMMVFDADFALIIGCWGLDDDARAWQIIPRDIGKEQRLLQREEDFLMHLRFQTEPQYGVHPALKNGYYARIYGETKKEVVTLPGECEQILIDMENLDARIEAVKSEISRMETERESLIALLYPYVGEAEKAEYDAPGKTYTITCKAGMTRAAINYEGLKADHPDVYKECVKAEVVEKLDAKKARLKKFAGTIDSYRIPGHPNGERKWKLVIRDKE